MGNETIGANGVGDFIQNGGINTVAGTLILGNPGIGFYTLNSGGSLSAANEIIGDSGIGTFTQNGGTNTVTGTLTLGATGIGDYTLNTGGTLSALNETIGDQGIGEFTQNGGTNTVTRHPPPGQYRHRRLHPERRHPHGPQRDPRGGGHRRVHPERRHQYGDQRLHPGRWPQGLRQL